MKKLDILLLTVFSLFMAWTAINQDRSPDIQESITYFPIDPNVTFKTAKTSLDLKGDQSVIWKVQSTLDRTAYLRQDVGLLYSNGRLIDKLGKWKQNTATLTQRKKIKIKPNTHLQAISFHYAEIHGQNNQIFSAQALSAAQQNKPNSQTELALKYSWNNGVRHFSVVLDSYRVFPLQVFDEKVKKEPLPGFSQKETVKVVGQLWEGLYKNYFLGIKKADGQIASPIGSTLPLVLVAKDKSHLLVLTETAEHEPILLRQMIEDTD